MSAVLFEQAPSQTFTMQRSTTLISTVVNESVLAKLVRENGLQVSAACFVPAVMTASLPERT